MKKWLFVSLFCCTFGAFADDSILKEVLEWTALDLSEVPVPEVTRLQECSKYPLLWQQLMAIQMKYQDKVVSTLKANNEVLKNWIEIAKVPREWPVQGISFLEKAKNRAVDGASEMKALSQQLNIAVLDFADAAAADCFGQGKVNSLVDLETVNGDLRTTEKVNRDYFDYQSKKLSAIYALAKQVEGTSEAWPEKAQQLLLHFLEVDLRAAAAVEENLSTRESQLVKAMNNFFKEIGIQPTPIGGVLE